MLNNRWVGRVGDAAMLRTEMRQCLKTKNARKFVHRLLRNLESTKPKLLWGSIECLESLIHEFALCDIDFDNFDGLNKARAPKQPSKAVVACSQGETNGLDPKVIAAAIESVGKLNVKTDDAANEKLRHRLIMTFSGRKFKRTLIERLILVAQNPKLPPGIREDAATLCATVASEFFVHEADIGNIEELVDKAVETINLGYVHKHLQLTLHNIHVHHGLAKEGPFDGSGESNDDDTGSSRV